MPMPLTIYHNPACSKSRATLQLIEASGQEHKIVLYLDTPPDRETLTELLRLLKLSPRELLRRGETAYKDNNLGDPSLADDTLIDAMVSYPILIERPIVVAEDRAVIGRPPENVNALL